MADLELDEVIDSVYGTLEKGVAILGTALGVDMRDVVSTSTTKARAAATAATSAGPAFRVDSVIDGETGQEVILVTDGCGTSIDCRDRANAQAVLDALAARGAQIAR